MADNKPFFPGFDEDPPPTTPSKNSQSPPTPAFDPFAGIQVKPPGLTEGASTAQTAGKVSDSASRPLPPTQQSEEDVKPGARKDLWKCPHCGAGNRPDRDTCRSCSKSKHDLVVIPWQRKPVVWIGVGLIAVLVIGGLVLSSRVDLSLRDPDVAHADTRPRIGGSSSGSYDLLAGIRLDVDRCISVCGRIAGLGTGPGGIRTIALALGTSARDAQITAMPGTHGGFTFEAPAQGVVLACVFKDPADVKKLVVGSVLSLVGETGSLLSAGSFVRDAEGLIPVYAIQLRTE